ncbi:unnamed protein product [Discula destructiva]
MSSHTQRKTDVGTQEEVQHDDISAAEAQPTREPEEKEFYSPVELDGPTIPRERYYSETSSTIAPQVISTNISYQPVPDSNVESTSGKVELSTERTETGQDTGLVPRGIGTRWSWMPKGRRIMVLCVAAIATVLLAVLLGVLLSRKHNAATPAADFFDILPTSKLAALTFQNVNNLTDKSVFFQISTSHALMRARNNATTNQQWVFENISQSMIDGGSAIFPKPGTPIVAASPDAVDTADLPNFWIDLYFLSPTNLPFQIWSWSTPQTSPSKDLLWHPEGLQNYQVIFDTGFVSGTQLAVYRDQCVDGCSNSSRLLYQGANGDLMMGQSTVVDWMSWNVTDLSSDEAGNPQLPQLELNSSLALTRYSPSKAQKPVGMRMYYDVSHQLEEYLLLNGSWSNGNLEASLGDQATPPDVSAVAYTTEPGGTSLDRTLVTVLFDNGTIAVHWQEPLGASWSTGFAPPTNVSSLAVNFDLQAYCLTGDTIQEWEIDRLMPTKWAFVSNVTTG